MSIVTVPKELSKSKDLIAIPRKAYSEFLSWQKMLKSAKTFKPTASEKKALKRARKNLSKGEYTTLDALRHELGIDN